MDLEPDYTETIQRQYKILTGKNLPDKFGALMDPEASEDLLKVTQYFVTRSSFGLKVMQSQYWQEYFRAVQESERIVSDELEDRRLQGDRPLSESVRDSLVLKPWARESWDADPFAGPFSGNISDPHL